MATLPANAVVSVAAKLASSPIAADNSANVSNTAGAELIKSLTAELTKPVDAICVVAVPLAAVTAVGVPRRSTELIIELDLALIIGIYFSSLKTSSEVFVC